MMMRRLTILAAAALASSLFSVAAMASGSAHHAFGDERVQPSRPAYRSFASHGPDVHERGQHCYTPEEISKYPPWPPYCS